MTRTAQSFSAYLTPLTAARSTLMTAVAHLLGGPDTTLRVARERDTFASPGADKRDTGGGYRGSKACYSDTKREQPRGECSTVGRTPSQGDNNASE